MTGRLYWLGNAAKTRIIAEILSRTAHGQETLIFDYGCGRAGDWPEILAAHPHLRLIGYEPHGPSYRAARERLDGLRAEILTGSSIETASFQADIIVSLSVLEHVYDRAFYLRTAKRLLAKDGVFYLNYDDGHFRTMLDLSQPRQWPSQVREWVHNLLAWPLGRLGCVGFYQGRVYGAELDRLLGESRLRTTRVFYSNLASLKALQKRIPPEQLEDYGHFWLQVEEWLNSSFAYEGPVQLGDRLNLWGQMPSRTLVLEHAPTARESDGEGGTGAA